MTEKKSIFPRFLHKELNIQKENMKKNGPIEGTRLADEQAVSFDWVPGDVILDLYEVQKVIEGFGENFEERDYHEGGFGRVYKVWHRPWRREDFDGGRPPKIVSSFAPWVAQRLDAEKGEHRDKGNRRGSGKR